MNDLFNVNGKVILLTGGSGILGACMARHLAGEGARVVILDRNEELGNKLAEEIKAAGHEALFLPSDVLNKEVLEKTKKRSWMRMAA